MPTVVHRTALPGVAAALTLAVLAPLLTRGYVLTYDMVFAPRHVLLPDGLGLGSALPRSVPSDAVVALATMVLAGDIVQKIALAAALFAGAWGAGLLVPTESTAVRVVAALSYGWSAYVAERLLIGHWQLLLAYACLPWVASAGLALRNGERAAVARMVLACAPAALTPTGGLIAGATAVVCAGRRGWLALVIAVTLNAPWWVPAVLRPAGGTLSAPEGVAAFSARAESWGGPVTSLLGLGGIWNAEVTPASRGNPLVPALILATTVLALLGLRVLADRWGVPAARALVLLGAFGVLLGALGSIAPGVDLLRWLTAEVPGAGLLRDSQKWVAWWALPLALGFALAVEAGAAALRTRAARAALLAAAAVFPVAVLPDLAWGGGGRLATVAYPDDWPRVRTLLAADDRPGDVLTLPLSAFRQFGWNGGRTQLDPAPRVLTRTTVVDDTLVVAGRPVPGEDPRMVAIRRTLREGGELGALGIGWVLVEHGTPGQVDPTVLAELDEVSTGPWLTLYRVPGPISTPPIAGPPRALVLAADGAALALVGTGVLWRLLPAGRLGYVGRCRSARE